ncbi:hypothetical protein HA466_0161720 [Hirschfeldia incana]|nr:hypothetical protein HA466_0161720 [Hirschfeldia incana]
MSRLYITSPPPVYARRNGQKDLVESTKIGSHHIVASKTVQRKENKDRQRLKTEKSIKQPTKKVFDDAEQLEKSCLTEEHEHEHLHLGGYLSDDGSQNSNKRRRRREASPSVESNIKATPVAGNLLRIRFTFKKSKEAEVVVAPLDDGVCSTSVTRRPSETSSSVLGYDENLLSISLQSDKIAIITKSKKKKKHRTSKESRYSSLFDEPALPSISVEEDDGWLVCAKRQEDVSTKSALDEDVVINMQKSRESCCFPRSQLLSEVGIFSLPYTVLF